MCLRFITLMLSDVSLIFLFFSSSSTRTRIVRTCSDLSAELRSPYEKELVTLSKISEREQIEYVGATASVLVKT